MNLSKRLYSAANLTEATLIKGILRKYAIEVHLRGGNLSIAIGELPIDASSVQLYVCKDDFEKALAIINEYENNISKTNNNMHSWECNICSKVNPKNFTICWNCQSIA